VSRGFRKTDVLGQLPALRRFARSLARDESEAEDLVHDALVRAYEGRQTFRSGGSLSAWLMSILYNTFATGRRRDTAEQRRIEQVGAAAPQSEQPPQDHAVRLAQIRDAFEALPDEQRAVLHLVAVEGASYQEAASTLGIPIGTLMSRLGRARAALRAFEESGSRRTDGFLNAPRLRVVGGLDDTSS
jgi:RNA polymerase sigma-70 factor (ECF subfamily)